MLDSSAGTRRGDRAGAAMALLDVALWDLKAKANREPLWKTLGGARPRPIAFASCIDGTLNEKETFARLARLAREFGCRSAVLRMASSAAADLRRLARARKILSREGVDPELALAAAESWSSARTIRRVGDIEKRIDLAWIAPAATGGGSRALKSISEGVRAAVCAVRGLLFPADFRPHFRERSIDIVQVDLRATGITGALQLADAAFGFELPVMLCDAPGNIQAQLAGAMPYVMNVEITEPLPPVDLFRSDVRIEHGRAVSGDAPGNGLVIDRAALARAAVDSLPARRGRT
jgi:L-alanine-DL-glutamate epimerase-like enolase superfamily enzyme